MEISAATAAGGSTIAPRPVPKIAADKRSHVREAPGPVIERCMRIIGRAFLGLPASTWLLVDCLLIGVAVYGAYQIVPPLEGTRTPHVAVWQAAAIFTFSVILASLVFGALRARNDYGALLHPDTHGADVGNGYRLGLRHYICRDVCDCQPSGLCAGDDVVSSLRRFSAFCGLVAHPENPLRTSRGGPALAVRIV